MQIKKTDEIKEMLVKAKITTRKKANGERKANVRRVGRLPTKDRSSLRGATLHRAADDVPDDDKHHDNDNVPKTHRRPSNLHVDVSHSRVGAVSSHCSSETRSMAHWGRTKKERRILYSPPKWRGSEGRGSMRLAGSPCARFKQRK